MAGWTPPKTKEEWDTFLDKANKKHELNESQTEALRQQAKENERLSVPPTFRILGASAASFVAGMALGIVHGSKVAGLRFRAEHAHKLPTTTTGWFMYHKSKNYVVASSGLKEGLKMGCRVSFWTTTMFLVENMYDQQRQNKDFVNTVMACLTVGGGFSLWNRFSLPMTARTTRTALIVGLAYGGLQDAIGALRGRPIGYIDWVRRRFGSDSYKQEQKTP